MFLEHNGLFISCNTFSAGGKVLAVCTGILLWQQSVSPEEYRATFYLLVLMGPYDFYCQLENEDTARCVKQNCIVYSNAFSQ